MDTFWGSGSVEGGEQRPSCSTFWSDNATGLAGGLAQCHGRAGREYCREEKAFCEHNIRCFRPILTVRGGQEDKRPTKCGGIFYKRKERRGEKDWNSVDCCSFVYLPGRPGIPASVCTTRLSRRRKRGKSLCLFSITFVCFFVSCRIFFNVFYQLCLMVCLLLSL